MGNRKASSRVASAGIILACLVVAVTVPKAFFASGWYRSHAGDWSIHLWYWIQPAFWSLVIACGWLMLRPGRRGASMGVLIGPNRAAMAVLVALGCSLPMLLVGLTSPGEEDLSMLFYSTAQAGFFEELLFRGFAFGLLVQLARWRVWPAAVLTGAIFGLIHVRPYTWDALASQWGGLAFIGLGGVLYAWLFWRWRWNLWFVIALHTFMNLWWGLWDLGESSLGGWAMWASRVLAVGLAIWISELAHKRPKLGRAIGARTMDG